MFYFKENEVGKQDCSKYCSISFKCHKDEKDKLRLQLLFYAR